MEYYELLEVHPKASTRAIDRAFRDLCRRCHPDVQPAEKKAWAHEKMVEITEAYRVLSDPKLREEYDKRTTGQGARAQPAPGRPRPQTAPSRVSQNCSIHPERPKIATCMVCGVSLCSQCRMVIGSQVCCPTCARNPSVVRSSSSRTIPRADQPALREPWFGRLIQRRLGIENVWDVSVAAGSLVVFAFSCALIWVNVGFRLFALSRPGAISTQVWFGFMIGVLCGLLLWSVFMFLKPSRRWLVPLCVLPVVLTCGLVGQRAAFGTDHLLAARTAVRQKRYQSAIVNYTMAEWAGQLEARGDALSEIGSAYSKLATAEDRKAAAQAARGAVKYLGEWLRHHPDDAQHDEKILRCFQLTANYFDAKRGRTATWDEAVSLWQTAQEARPDDPCPIYYEGLSHMGRFHCMRRLPMHIASRQLRKGVTAFYDITGLNEALRQVDAEIRPSGLLPAEEEALKDAAAALDKAIEEQRPGPSGGSGRPLTVPKAGVPSDVLYWRAIAYLQLDNHEKATLDLSSYLQADPNGAYAEHAGQLLEEIGER